MQTRVGVSAIRALESIKGGSCLGWNLSSGRTGATCPGIVGTELRGARRAEICGTLSSDWSRALIWAAAAHTPSSGRDLETSVRAPCDFLFALPAGDGEGLRWGHPSKGWDLLCTSQELGFPKSPLNQQTQSCSFTCTTRAAKRIYTFLVKDRHLIEFLLWVEDR